MLQISLFMLLIGAGFTLISSVVGFGHRRNVRKAISKAARGCH
jgi:hypothetical protein